MVRVRGLVWDDWNIAHITRHKVSVEEVEQACRFGGKKVLETYGERLLVLGKSGRRLLTVVLAPEENDRFYVVTARDASKKERRFFLK